MYRGGAPAAPSDFGTILPSFPPLPGPTLAEPLRPLSNCRTGATIESRKESTDPVAAHGSLLGLREPVQPGGLLHALIAEYQRSPPPRFRDQGPTPQTRFGTATPPVRNGRGSLPAAASHHQPPGGANPLSSPSHGTPASSSLHQTSQSSPRSLHQTEAQEQEEQLFVALVQEALLSELGGQDFPGDDALQDVEAGGDGCTTEPQSRRSVDTPGASQPAGSGDGSRRKLKKLASQHLSAKAVSNIVGGNLDLLASIMGLTQPALPDVVEPPVCEHVADAIVDTPKFSPRIMHLRDLVRRMWTDKRRLEASRGEQDLTPLTALPSPQRPDVIYVGGMLEKADTFNELDRPMFDQTQASARPRGSILRAMSSLSQDGRESTNARPMRARRSTTFADFSVSSQASEKSLRDTDYFGGAVPSLQDAALPRRRSSKVTSRSWRSKSVCVPSMAGFGGMCAVDGSGDFDVTSSQPSYISCEKCEDTRTKSEEDKRKCLLETEHLRRGLDKLLEACSSCMSTPALQQLIDSLQLGVRYITAPDPKDLEYKKLEGRPERHANGGGDVGANVGVLKRKIAALEEEIHQLSSANERLRRQQEAAADQRLQPAVRRAPGSAVVPVSMEDAMVQTRAAESPLSDASPSGDSRQPREQSARDLSVSEPGLKASRRHESDERSNPEDTDAARRQPRDSREPREQHREPRPRRVHEPSDLAGIDDSPVQAESCQRDLNKLQAEYDLLQMKFKSSEKASGNFERQVKDLQQHLRGSEDEVGKLKQRLDDNQSVVDCLETKVAELSARLQAATHPGAKAAVAQPPPASRVKKPSKKGPDVPLAPKTGITKRTLITDDGALRPSEELGRTRDTAAAAEAEEDLSEDDLASDIEERASPAMADKCVGNGPGYGLQDEPLRCKGKRAPGLPKTMNSDGRCYVRHIRSVPELASAGEAIEGQQPPKKTALVTIVKQPSKRFVAAGSEFHSRPWSVHEPEPFLLEVWERHPKGHRHPSKRELRALGALEPPAVRPGTSPGALRHA